MPASNLLLFLLFSISVQGIAQKGVNLNIQDVERIHPNTTLEFVEGNVFFDAFMISENEIDFFHRVEEHQGDVYKLAERILLPFDPNAEVSIDLKTIDTNFEAHAFIEYVSDVDQDGWADIIVRDGLTEKLYACVYRGEGVFQKAVPLGKADTEVVFCAFDDMSGEGGTLILYDDYRIINLIDLDNFPEIESYKVNKKIGYTPVPGFILDGSDKAFALHQSYSGDSYAFASAKKKSADFDISYSLGDQPHLFDVDNDGEVDVMAFNEKEVYWRKNEGENQLGEPITLFTMEDLMGRHPELTPDYLGYWQFIPEDLNGDHLMDFIAYEEYAVSLIQQKDGSFEFQLIHEDPYDASAIMIGDMDNDGDADFLVDTFYGITIHINTEGTFSTAQILGESYMNLEFVADVNGDGVKDVFIIGNRDGDLYWFESYEGKYLEGKPFSND